MAERPRKPGAVLFCRKRSIAARLLRKPQKFSNDKRIWAPVLAPLWSGRAEPPAPTEWEWPAGLRPTGPAQSIGTDKECRDPRAVAEPAWGPLSGATGCLVEPPPAPPKRPGRGCFPLGGECALYRQTWQHFIYSTSWRVLRSSQRAHESWKAEPINSSHLWCMVMVSFSISFSMVFSEGRVSKPVKKKNDCVFKKRTYRANIKAWLQCTRSPLNTLVAQRPCISDRGLMAPKLWMKPTMARVGRVSVGGNTCL